jgi:dipeptidyl aminopeptidase/acylaminoacyl peptidase
MHAFQIVKLELYALRLLSVILIPFWAGASVARPLSVEDILNGETVGNALFSPDGRYLVYERGYKYKNHTDFSSLDHFADRGSLRSDEVFVVDLHKPTWGRPLLPPKNEMRRWLGGIFWTAGFSPDGSWLLLYELQDNKVALVAVRLATGTVHRFHFAPDFSEGYATGKIPLWVSNSKVIYGALADGIQPAVPATPRLTGSGFFNAWERSWAGREPSYTTWSTHVAKPPVPGDLIMEDLQTGAAKILAKGRFEHILPSPNGRYLLAVGPTATERRSEKSGACLDSPQGMVMIDINSGESRGVTCGLTMGVGDRGNKVRWSPTSRSFAYFAWPSGQNAGQGAHFVFDIQSGNAVRYRHEGLILESTGSTGTQPMPTEFFWDGRALVVPGRAVSDRNSSGLAPLVVSDMKWERRWFLLKPDVTPLDIFASLSADSTAAPMNSELVSIETARVLRYRNGGWQPVRIRSKQGRFRPSEFVEIGVPAVTAIKGRLKSEDALAVPQSDGSLRVLLKKEQEELFAFNSKSSWTFRANTAGTFFVHGLDDARRKLDVVVDHIYRPNAKFEDADCVTISYRARGTGQLLQSSVALPSEFKRDNSFGMVVVVYPSLPNRSCEKLQESTMLLASYGFVAMEVATPGSIQRTDPQHPWGAMPALVEDAIDAAVREGYADSNRVGLYGFSQGAHAALWVAAKSSRFRAVVAYNGIADNHLAYFNIGRDGEFGIDESPPGVNPNFERGYGDIGMGTSALDRPDLFVENSAITYAKDLNAAVLLINSDMDSFPRAHFDGMYAALERAGKSARLVTFWGEGHHMASPANMKAFYAVVAEWYREAFQGRYGSAK